MSHSALLYKVKITYNDILGEQDWDRELARRSKLPIEPDMPPRPSRKQASVYVAVMADPGGDPLKVAGDLACGRIIGPRESWEKWLPIVERVKYISDVHIDKEVVRDYVGSAPADQGDEAEKDG